MKKIEFRSQGHLSCVPWLKVGHLRGHSSQKRPSSPDRLSLLNISEEASSSLLEAYHSPRQSEVMSLMIRG